MASGNPYISENYATINTLKVLKDSQSRVVFGLVKPKTKRTKAVELTAANPQRPQEEE